MLLSLFATVLFLGTLVESWYDSAVAHELVYQTWWFVLLLGLLGVNILFAAVKKWPWRRHQTGFLITHLGLLSLVAGGVVNVVAGVQGTLVLVDAEGARGPHASDFVVEQRARLLRVRRGDHELIQAPFAPGPLAWRAHRHHEPQVESLTAVLDRLARPGGRGWSRTLADGSQVEVIDFFPHARPEPFAPATAGTPSFPALRIELGSAATGRLPPRWLAFYQEHRASRLGPGLVELLGRNSRPEQIHEFQYPPAPEKVGSKGQLVLHLGGQLHRLDVDAALSQERISLGWAGWNLRITRFLPNFNQENDPRPTNPALSFELAKADGTRASLVTGARQAGEVYPLLKSTVPWEALGDFWVWYHPPDQRYGDPEIQAMLQLLCGPDGRLWYRSFSSARAGGFGLEKTGLVAPGQRQAIWQGMNWSFQIVDFRPEATPGPNFVPVQRRAGDQETTTVPVIRCRLTHRGHREEFWVAQSQESWTAVSVAGEQFFVGYHGVGHPLHFTLTLQRAEQTTDPGSHRPASQSSFVLLNDPSRRLHNQPRVITLNQPLEHGGYRFYQSGYQPLGLDANGKPVSRSILTATHDPGLWLKYAGSSMVALGIVCMFYMKAYFFKRKGSVDLS